MTTYDEVLQRVLGDESSGKPVREPATGELIGYAPQHTADDLESAISRAQQAQPAWAALGDAARADALRRAADLVDASSEALVELLAREQGKPLNGPNARFEVGAVSTWLRVTADLQLDPQVVVEDDDLVAELVYEPLGVVAAIGPWNWPLMIGIWQIAPSLRMGNTVVVKPSGYTPLSVLALISVLNEALPADVLIGISAGRDVGALLAADPRVAKIMFTGSTATGRSIIESSAGNLARLTLELGGNDAGIVLPDVDPEAIAGDLFWGAFINTGQTCAALKRLYVHESQYEKVIDALARFSESVPLGPSLDESSLLGPVQNKAQFDIVSGLVEDARARGARIVTGGSPAKELGDLFYPVTLVADVADGDPIVDEEQFGPALPIIKYTDVEDAVRNANRLDVGLGASVWSADLESASEVAGKLKAGSVWINRHGTLHPLAPFGGVKGSGYGLEFGVDGLKAVAAPKVIHRPKA